jgi:hypothetical protein
MDAPTFGRIHQPMRDKKSFAIVCEDERGQNHRGRWVNILDIVGVILVATTCVLFKSLNIWGLVVFKIAIPKLMGHDSVSNFFVGKHFLSALRGRTKSIDFNRQGKCNALADE